MRRIALAAIPPGKMFRKILKKLHLPQKGQGLVEYALILVLVAIVVIAILLTLGPAVSRVYCRIANSLQGGSCNMGVTIISSTPGNPSPGQYTLSVSIQVTDPGDATMTVGGQSQTKPCNTSCSFSFSGVPQHSSYTISTTAGGSAGGSY